MGAIPLQELKRQQQLASMSGGPDEDESDESKAGESDRLPRLLFSASFALPSRTKNGEGGATENGPDSPLGDKEPITPKPAFNSGSVGIPIRNSPHTGRRGTLSTSQRARHSFFAAAAENGAERSPITTRRKLSNPHTTLSGEMQLVKTGKLTPAAR